MNLNFADFAKANGTRAARWHPGFPHENDWTGADWSNAMCGEAGEAANVVKKLRRHDAGVTGSLDPPPAALVTKLADELADTFTYMDLLATYYGIDLAQAVVSKFNRISEREGLPDRIET